ncbi:BTAD domain-containing putative transcriptional regulator [Saccharothrix longispora]|uniref:DNA-binding SARP family transcriptional activator/tetratricopeptide (TPR) repeat protein n=1 Tax=Saccharothrix longispora TaxID=33920 RepID=A0ABU1Q7E1_9PSEU|nr:BTAD domain-containing putative transcriptional regulator [Saccharothrix longispora]MDR6598314.1 DNA-binding SARP family transcriptional activator/tetratricopeptide (TPR) repeat protein [Saccharothrix longispora]
MGSAQAGPAFGVLGVVEARVGGEPVDIGHPRRRSVLAALLVDVNRVVPVDELVDRVWGEHPPARARHSLYSHLSGLRRVVAPVGASLTRQAGGYVLTVDPASVDLHLFRELCARSREGDRPLAAADRALALWRGRAFEGADTPWFAEVARRLEQERLAAELHRNDLLLRLGLHADRLADLVATAAAHPVDERAAAQVLLAQHRCGRRAEALAHYRSVRDRLVDELGVEPGPRLRELHRRVLAGEPLPEPDRPTPRQLPAAPPHFVGRAVERAALDRHATALVVIAGTGGAGKTALALRWAHDNADRFPDGLLHADLRGFDPACPPVPPATVLRGFLEALGVPAHGVPAGPAEAGALYRSLLAGRRVLVLLDNAADAAQVLPLLPGGTSGLTLVTSRDRMTDLVAARGADHVGLDVLTGGESVALLAERLGRDRVDAEPAAVAELVERAARLPLALSVVAARAAVNPGFPLRALADELRHEHDRLDALDAVADVRAVFACSYRTLGADAARLFRLLGGHPGADVDAHAAASTAGVPVARARALLAELSRRHLVHERAPHRYGTHDLLRAYAAELARAHDTGAELVAARSRLVDHYLRTGYAAERRLAPHWPPITLPAARDGVVTREIGSYDEAMAWFDAEHTAVLGVLDDAVRHGWDAHAWQLPWVLTSYLNRRGRWREKADALRTALAAADRLGDRDALAVTHHLLGRAATTLGERATALDHLGRALELHRELGDETGQAIVHFSLAAEHEQRHDLTAARTHARRALELHTRTGDRTWQGFDLTALGWYAACLGDHAGALARCREAVALMDDRDGLAHCHQIMGCAHHHLGDHEESVAHHGRAVALFRLLGDRYREAWGLVLTGDAHRAAGREDRARATWSRALAILDGLGHDDGAAIRERLARVPAAAGR